MDAQQQPPENTDRETRLSVLAGELVRLRKEAVQGRKDSGIEDVWKAAEEAYLGIDDVNRAQWEKAQWAKPTSMQGPLTRDKTGSGDDNRSTVFIPLTARYVDAGHAKVSELLLPMDDKPFAFDPTPVPELIAAREMLEKVMQNGGELPPVPQQPVAAAVAPDSLMPGQPAAAMPQTPQDAFAAAKDAVDRATKSAKAAEKRIYDWIIEAKHAVEMRKVLFDSARIGTGVLKGPTVESRTSTALTRDGQGNVVIEIKKERKPGERQVDPWNLFPDPACGEDITKGSYCFERDYMSPAQVKKLPDAGGYLPEQIEKVLEEGPSKCYMQEDGSRNPAAIDDPKIRARRFELYHFYGEISAEDLQVANEKLASVAAKRETYFVIATLINDRVVRVVLNPLETGRLPYRVFPWRRRSGHWAGVGIGEQCSPAQVICNGSTRAMLTNAGQSAGVQLIIDRTSIVPVDSKWIITPNKVWVKKSDATIEDMTKAFTAVEIPDRQQSLMNIIEYSFRIAEESTNIPLISQGQSGATTPDTYGAAALQNNNANQLLRSIATTCDDCITEPLIRDYYEWLLLDPDVPNEEKGDFNINAHGSSALVERAIQDQVIQQLVEPSLNPAFGLSPERVMEEYLKSKRIDYRSLKLTDEEKAEIAKRQPPPAPAVQAAQIRAQAQLQSDKLREQTAQLRIQKDTDRDTTYVQAETQRTQTEFMSRREELAVRRELALLDYANKHQQTLEQIKAKLADTVMKLRTQKELALGSATIDLHKHKNPAPQVATPATEPPGRAPVGEAFQA
jgi:hypothetical protein